MVPIWNDHQAPGSWLIHLYSGNMLVKMCDCPDGTEAPQLQNTRKHVTYLSHPSWWFAKVPGLLQAFQAPLAVLCLKTAYVIGLDAGFIGWLCNSSICFFWMCNVFFTWICSIIRIVGFHSYYWSRSLVLAGSIQQYHFNINCLIKKMDIIAMKIMMIQMISQTLLFRYWLFFLLSGSMVNPFQVLEFVAGHDGRLHDRPRGNGWVFRLFSRCFNKPCWLGFNQEFHQNPVWFGCWSPWLLVNFSEMLIQAVERVSVFLLV